jgi:hypothetical protein
MEHRNKIYDSDHNSAGILMRSKQNEIETSWNDALVDFFLYRENPKGRIVWSECWRCKFERSCFLDETGFGPMTSYHLKEPIAVCMKCRVETCGKNEDGSQCEFCLAFGYPAMPEFNQEQSRKIANNRSEIHHVTSLDGWENFYDQEEDLFFNDFQEWKQKLGEYEQCDHSSLANHDHKREPARTLLSIAEEDLFLTLQKLREQQDVPRSARTSSSRLSANEDGPPALLEPVREPKLSEDTI